MPRGDEVDRPLDEASADLSVDLREYIRDVVRDELAEALAAVARALGAELEEPAQPQPEAITAAARRASIVAVLAKVQPLPWPALSTPGARGRPRTIEYEYAEAIRDAGHPLHTADAAQLIGRSQTSLDAAGINAVKRGDFVKSVHRTYSISPSGYYAIWI